MIGKDLTQKRDSLVGWAGLEWVGFGRMERFNSGLALSLEQIIRYSRSKSRYNVCEL